MLDLDATRVGPAPLDAATLVIVRESLGELEVLCMLRSKGSGFLGGAVVFPGGKVTADDRDPRWADRVDGVHEDLEWRIAACRECVEEVALCPCDADASQFVEWQEAIRTESLYALVTRANARLLTTRLVPFGRWVTPVAEARRFDARFFLFAAEANSSHRADAHEAEASFWGKPKDILRRFAKKELVLVPPTHRTLEWLSECRTVKDVFECALSIPTEPIRPKLATHNRDGEELPALVLPGDPAHEDRTPVLRGASRYVLIEGQWLPTSA